MGDRRRAVVAIFLLGLSASSCDRVQGPRDVGPTAEVGRLELSVVPRTGEAPLTVRLQGRLVGASSDGGCPSLAWDFGNGDVLIAQAEGCGDGPAPSEFVAEYTYRTAGAFEPFLRLLASDVAPSAAVQVLVGGPTPTPAAVAALPGPTIIIATPRGPVATAASPTEPVVAAATVALPLPTSALTSGAIAPTDAPTSPPTGPATVPGTARVVAAATAVPSGRPSATSVTAAARPGTAGAARAGILPADVYFLDARDGQVWRVPASGAGPVRVAGIDGPVGAYAVSPAGHIASTRGDTLRILVPGAEPQTVTDAGASAPVWSRDSRHLAYAANGVWVYDAVDGVRRRLTDAGSPLAWSADGSKLVLRGADGAPVVAVVADGTVFRLPLPPVTVAGWLPDRPVAWLAGAGLHVFAADDPPTLVRLLEERALVAAASVRPDLRLMALADRGSGPRAFAVDLTATVPEAEAAGPVLDIEPGTSFAWAPDGRTVAVADRAGLALLDTATGARVALVDRPARDPQWVVPAR